MALVSFFLAAFTFFGASTSLAVASFLGAFAFAFFSFDTFTSFGASTSLVAASTSLAVSALASSFLATFSLSVFLSAKPSAIASVTKDNTLSIDLEASSLAGIIKSTNLGSEFVSTIAKIGMFNF